MVERLVRNEKVWGSNPHTSKAADEENLGNFSAEGESDQPQRHGSPKEELKSSGLKLVVEFGGCRKAGDTLREVAKGVALAGEKLGDPRHPVEKVKVPKKFPWSGRRRKLQQSKSATDLQSAIDFSQGFGPIGKIAQPESESDGRKRIWWEGQVESVTLHHMLGAASGGLGQKGGTEIESSDRGRGQSFL